MLWFKTGASPEDHFKGLLHSYHTRVALASHHTDGTLPTASAAGDGDGGGFASVVAEAHRTAELQMPLLWQGLKDQGWLTTHVFFAAAGATITGSTSAREA